MTADSCESCAFWNELIFEEKDRRWAAAHRPYGEGPEPGRWGQCRLINDGAPESGERTADRAFTSDASGYHSWLTTRSDFGCVEHAERAVTIGDAGASSASRVRSGNPGFVGDGNQ